MELELLDRAFSRIYDNTYRKTAAFLTARSRQLSDVEDLLQETYLAVYRILAAQGPDAFENEEAYVLSVARSKLTDWYRKSGREAGLFALPPEGEEGDGWLAAVPDTAALPEELAAQRESIREVEALVAQKDEALQRAFYLHHCFGVSFPEIGKLLCRNESTVRSGVFRLTQEIRGRLERRSV